MPGNLNRRLARQALSAYSSLRESTGTAVMSGDRPMRAFAAALLIAGASAPAAAEEWYYVSDGEDGILFADADSVRQAGEAVTVLGFLGSAEPLDMVGQPPVAIWYWISQFEFLCPSGQYRVTRTDSYNERHLLEFSTDHSDAWTPVPAGSFVEGLHEFACDGARFSVSGDPFDFSDEIFFGSD